jgi:hypothetical protein
VGAVRHVHAVQFDPLTRKVWFATGDRDEESMIGYIEEGRRAKGEGRNGRLQIAAKGSQQARAVSLMFTPEFVYWGSDAGRDTTERCNWIHRWSRQTQKVERLAAVGGPVYYSTADARGRLFVSTAVEGSRSEPDRIARVWMSQNGEQWHEIAAWQKDAYPLPFGYGVLSFPQNSVRDGLLYVVGQGVKGGPATWVLEIGK